MGVLSKKHDEYPIRYKKNSKHIEHNDFFSDDMILVVFIGLAIVGLIAVAVLICWLVYKVFS